jgi:hypothetical protein
MIRARCRVRSADGRRTGWLPWKKNLIMNAGLDGVAVGSWELLMRQCGSGTGSNPVSNPSGAITFTQAGNVVTASAPFFQSTDVNAILKYGVGSAGAQQTVVSFTSSTIVNVSSSATVPSTVGTLWYVTQTALQSPHATTVTYVAGANGSTFVTSTGVATLQRTFLFAAEVGTVTITELGWFKTGSTMLGRVVLAGAGVTLVATQQLEVQLQVLVTYSPVSQVAVSDVSGGVWNTAGTLILEWVNSTVSASGIFDWIASNGTAGQESCFSAQGGQQAVQASIGAYSQHTSTQAGTGTACGFDQAAVLGTYTTGTYTTTWTGTFSISNAVGTISVIGFGPNGNFCATIALTTPQVKDSSHTLAFTWQTVWGRILTN